MSDNLNFHYNYIHNAFGSFFGRSLDYFADSLRGFKHQLVSTYDKAIEYIRNAPEELEHPNLPAIILNPTGDFTISDNGTGKTLYRFPNLVPGYISNIFDPIYADSNVEINVGFTRIKGEFELIFLLNSFYEYCDMRFFMLQLMGGEGRVIYPEYINTYLILPDEVKNYTYNNEYTGVNYTLDWQSAGAYDHLIPTINKNEVVFPCRIRPWYKLISLSDGSEKYGGTDSLAQWRLTASIEYEVEIPSFLIIKTDYLAQNLVLEMQFGSAYSEFKEPPINRELTYYNWTTVEDEQASILLNFSLPDESEIIQRLSLILNERYYHLFNESDVNTTEDLIIDSPSKIYKPEFIILNSKKGNLNYGSDYLISSDGMQIIVKNQRLIQFSENDILEIYIYQLTSDEILGDKIDTGDGFLISENGSYLLFR